MVPVSLCELKHLHRQLLGARVTAQRGEMGGVDFAGTKSTDMTVPETTVTREELTNLGTTGNFDSVVDPPTKFSKALLALLPADAASSKREEGHLHQVRRSGIREKLAMLSKSGTSTESFSAVKAGRASTA